ncbi:MAG: ankyrin repeat domain-containing protein [Armatimonadetes bacterium]|nr:ankyrin repeat domain-containing protein [Armatimonadota bacterium]
MNARGLLIIVYAAVLCAGAAAALDVAADEVLIGLGILLGGLFLTLLVAMAAARLLKLLGRSPIQARDLGLGLGVVLVGAASLVASFRAGAERPTIVWGAVGGALLSAAIVGYEAYRTAQRRKVGLRVLDKLEKGRKEAFARDIVAAEGTYFDAILDAELHLGSRDPRTLLGVRYLAEAYQETGHSRRGLRLWHRCIRAYADQADPSLSEYAACLYGLARFHLEQQNPGEAKRVAEKAMGVLALDVSANPYLYGDVLQMLAGMYAREKEFERAAAVSEEALKLLDRAGLDIHRSRLMVNLVEYHVRFDRPEEAEALAHRCLEERQRLGLAEDETIARIHHSRASLRKKRGEDPLPLEVEALKVLRRAGGPEHPLTQELLQICLPAIAAEGVHRAYREMFLAIREGSTSKVVALLEKEPGLVNAVDGSGWTALQWAAYFGFEGMVEQLVMRGARVTVGQDDMTPLHLAARWGHTKIVVDLVRKGADVQALDGFGSTSLHCAAASAANRVVDALVAEGARVEVVNHAGMTPLHCAALSGRSRLIVDLVDKGAQINTPIPSTGETPLHLAVRMGHRGATECLLISGADRGRRDHRGKTPMALARAQGRDDLITALQSHQEGA